MTETAIPESSAPAAPSAPPTSSDPSAPPDLSILVPMHNESDALRPFFERIDPVLAGLGLSCEILCVDDGSTDDTRARLRARQGTDPRLRLVVLSRNFGKEAALTAGLDHARGRAVVVIDADLQDPPELIADFVARWREGYEVVYGVRTSRRSDTRAKRITAQLFYRFFTFMAERGIPADTGDFRLMDRRVVEALRRLPERSRFMKGLFAWVGFHQTAVPFRRAERESGDSKWNYWKLWNFALTGVTSFSTVPLRVWSYVGIGVSGLAFLYAAFLVLRTLIHGIDVPGYASLMVVVLMLGGIQLLSLGVIGEYLGRLYEEAKGRPLYLIDEIAEPERPDSGA